MSGRFRSLHLGKQIGEENDAVAERLEVDTHRAYLINDLFVGGATPQGNCDMNSDDEVNATSLS